MKCDDPVFQSMIAQLVETLQEELRQHQRLVRIVRRKKVALLRNSRAELDMILRAEKEVLGDLATVERDRIELLTQLGEVLGHAQPSRLRIAELVLHSEPCHRDELLDIREDMRDIADELEDLSAVEPVFTHHRQDNVRLFVSPNRWKRGLDVHDPEAGAPEARPVRERDAAS